MNATPTALPGCLIIEPQVFPDDRGFFFECYNKQKLAEIGIDYAFVQDNYSHSRKNVLRGLHYQIAQPQGKLVRVVAGEIFDVAVDLRQSSSHFGQWEGVRLSSKNKLMFWIPPGFAHGFVVLSDEADLLYKTTDFYAASQERTILWNDPDLHIDWLITAAPIMSEKDRQGAPFRLAEKFA
ncbi:MAG TPA: dTDP-4-dehydrorhamnose 3,5-epimerase [Candidatus Angelobacter sp.]|jgi:dTDP-4-dehydrorhamnose 3,5-epimerase